MKKTPKTQVVKVKTNCWDYLGLHQTERFPHSKGNNQQSRETRNRMEENLCKLNNQQGTNVEHLQRASEAQQTQNKPTYEERDKGNEQTLKKITDSNG